AEEAPPPEPIPFEAARLAHAETASPLRDRASDDAPAASSPDAVRSIADRAFQDARMLSAIRDLDVLTTKTAQSLQAIVGADSVSIYFRNRTRWMGYSTSESLQSRLNRALPKESRLADQAIRQGLPIVITDTASRLADVGNLVHDTGIRSFALLPIRVNGGIGGLAYLNFDVVERANEVFDADMGRAIELVLNCAGNVAGAVWEQREAHANAAIDGLTDAYTLEQFERMLAAEIERARRYRFSVSILAFDVDDFSRFNETHGRAFGDEVLRRIAGTVRSVERASDVLARRGDDEFVALLPQTTARGAEIVARRLQTALAEDVVVRDRSLSVRASIGIATFPDEAADAASLLNAAELALYAAKAKASGVREAQKAGKHS
ncbi:MAG TPA: sensor domain-containing diguanylate cyclase, partial [Chloroflexota bacterium]|nr:sensor domain-containing diguanylate cyclase [Chloroflexota bacterium]